MCVASWLAPSILVLATLACVDATPSPTHHPTPENLPAAGSPTIVGESFPAGVLSSDDSLAWLAMRDALLAAQPVVRLGELGLGIDSMGPEVFGLVADVAMDGDDNLFVLDRRNHQVRVFDPTGEYLFCCRRRGRGPQRVSRPQGN